MKIGHLYLALTVIFDSIGVSLLNKANGVNDLKYLLAGLFFVNLSLIFISMSFKTINITIANASFAGLTVLLVTMIGYFCFNERYTLFQYFCIATIIFGVVALNLTGVGK